MKADEPLNIPQIQRDRISLEQRNGWEFIGWIEEEGIMSMEGIWWGRVLKDGSVQVNTPQDQDKSLSLTKDYSGMWTSGNEINIVPQTVIGRKAYQKKKALKRINSLCTQ